MMEVSGQLHAPAAWQSASTAQKTEMGPRACLDAVTKMKTFSYRESSPGLPVRSLVTTLTD
jgi:hypothetical protein